MSKSENLGSFVQESKPIIKEYMETRMEIFRLQGVRIASKSAGFLIWVIISLFLLFLILIFSGIVLGCWLSSLTNSYTMGFGLTTLLFLVIFALLAIFRNALFIRPIMQSIIRSALDDARETEPE
ncbi:MAG: hypothetical protein ACHQEM_00915 [Chitinophagales bacterium]